MYLAENGIDCEDTCTHINESYGCFNKLNTHEANQVFITARDPSNYTLVVNITCDEAPSSAVTAYSRTLHPSYDVITGECSGYKDAPLKINCTAEEIIDSNTRRLCYCVDIGEFEKNVSSICFLHLFPYKKNFIAGFFGSPRRDINLTIICGRGQINLIVLIH